MTLIITATSTTSNVIYWRGHSHNHVSSMRDVGSLASTLHPSKYPHPDLFIDI